MATSRTYTPPQQFSMEELRINKPMRDSLAVALNEGLQASKAQRQVLDETLDYWNDMVEMNVAPRDEPWPNAKSMCVPIVAMMMEAVDSRLTNAVYVPRLYVVNALTDNASQYVHDVENWYNAEFRRRKWLRPHLECQMLALRDGISWMEILWEHRVSERNVVSKNIWTGQKEVQKATIVDYHGARLTPVECRDLFLLPATAIDQDAAETVYRACYFSEADLWELVESETMWEDAVKQVIAYHSTGQNDLAEDDLGTATYEQGGELSVGSTGTMDPQDEDGDGLAQRGIFKVWRVHTKKYALGKSKSDFQEVVLWQYDQTPVLMGAGPYEYWHGRRPFVKNTPMPRPRRCQGWSVPERLRGYQEEANARSNQRGDAMDLMLSPPMYKVAGANPADKDKMWGPGVFWDVQNKEDVGVINFGTIDPSSWQDETLSYRYAAVMVGIDAPTMPLMGSGKIPMKQQQQMQVATNVRLDRMAMEQRLFAEEVLWHIHQLNLQYGDDEVENDLNGTGITTLQEDPQNPSQMQPYTISYDALSQAYVLGVAGSNGALDQDSERDSALRLYAMLMQNPLTNQHLDRVHAVTTHVLNKYNLPEITRFIGTNDDALKQQQAQQQAAQKQHDEQMQLQVLSHTNSGKLPEGPPGGQPPQAVGQPQMQPA